MSHQARAAAAAVVATLAVLFAVATVGKSEPPVRSPNGAAPSSAGGGGDGGRIVGRPATGGKGITETVATIMKRAEARGLGRRPVIFNAEEPHRRPFVPAQDPLAPAVPSWPPQPQGYSAALIPLSPQVVSANFPAVATALGESPWIPPDSMGDVGPTQILVHVNGRVKVFDKTGAVGGLNADDTSFWDPVRGGEDVTDPEIRYDRLSGRWFAAIVNFAATNNRIMLAVSSGPT
ncbi:MAG TPA: hypothetical protein VKF61_09045, partial [Candidatus Polarisedimenticolia bacterium]|nr:hypothetical protein [Candidatus Polarisedimenticolia bacterium]